MTVDENTDIDGRTVLNGLIALSIFGILLYLAFGSWVIPMVLAGWTGVLEFSKRWAGG